MKFDVIDPKATPNPKNKTRTNPVFSLKSSETYSGPLIMATMYRYPLDKPIKVTRNTNMTSDSKITGRWLLGWALHNINKGTNSHLKQDNRNRSFGLLTGNFILLDIHLPTKSATQNMKKLVIGMKNLPDQISWFGWRGTTKTVSGGKTAIVIQLTTKTVNECHLTARKVFHPDVNQEVMLLLPLDSCICCCCWRFRSASSKKCL